MKRGPKPLPLSILKARGSSEVRRQVRKHPEAVAQDGEPGCPSCLDREAKAEWRRCIKSLKHMGVLSPADRAALAGLCQNWSLWTRLVKKIDGFIDRWIGTQEEARILKAADSAFSNYIRGCALFGLTPSDRTRLRPEPETKGEDKPPSLQEFLSSKKTG